MAEEKAKKMMEAALNKVKFEDITHKGFLKPIEVALKNYHTELLDEESNLKAESLPVGLKIAVATSPESQKRILQDVQAIDPQQESHSYEDLKSNNQDNMLTLMKKREGIQLAICVCMYS